MDEARIKLLSGPSWLQRPLRMPTLQPRSCLNDCTRSGTNNDDWKQQLLIDRAIQMLPIKTAARKRLGLPSYYYTTLPLPSGTRTGEVQSFAWQEHAPHKKRGTPLGLLKSRRMCFPPHPKGKKERGAACSRTPRHALSLSRLHCCPRQ